MRLLLPIVLICCFVQLNSVSALASSLQGNELAAYDAYCPEGNYRAVWAEPLPGHLQGWTNLVCLNEDSQQTSYWFVTPDGKVQAPHDTVLPEYKRAFISSELTEVIEALPADQLIVLLIDFKYDEPSLSPEQFGAPAVTGGSMGSGGTNVPTEITYFLDGEIVTQDEYEAWEAIYDQALRDMDAERGRLVEQQSHVALYELVDANQWHDWLDVDALNNGGSERAYWLFPGTMVIELNGEQARSLLTTGRDYLKAVELYSHPVNDVDGGSAQSLPQSGSGMEKTQNSRNEPASPADADEQQEKGRSTTGGSSGWIWLTQIFSVLLFRIKEKRIL